MNSSAKYLRPRITLGGLLLLVAALATAMASYRIKHQLADVKASVESMRPLARVLRVEDPASIAAIARMATRPDELIFDVYIPQPAAGGKPQQLALVLDEIVQPGNELPQAQYTHPIEPGRHVIEIVHQKPPADDADALHRIAILLDNRAVIEATRGQSWIETSNSTSTGLGSDTTTFAAEGRAELYRRVFQRKTPEGSASGMLLWIEPRK